MLLGCFVVLCRRYSRTPPAKDSGAPTRRPSTETGLYSAQPETQIVVITSRASSPGVIQLDIMEVRGLCVMSSIIIRDIGLVLRFAGNIRRVAPDVVDNVVYPFIFVFLLVALVITTVAAGVATEP